MGDLKLINLENYFCGIGIKSVIFKILLAPKIPGLGNLNLKYLNILYRMKRVNTIAEEHYNEWKEVRKKGIFDPMGIMFFQEELVFHIRRCVDDMISFSWVLYTYKKNPSKVISEIEVGDIGNYLHRKDKDFNLFGADDESTSDKNIEFLNQLNDFANSYKHSFLEYEGGQIIGENEPIIHMLYSKYNKMGEIPYTEIVTQNYVMERFESLFKKFESQFIQ